MHIIKQINNLPSGVVENIFEYCIGFLEKAKWVNMGHACNVDCSIQVKTVPNDVLDGNDDVLENGGMY